jgi:hypothetical protein
MNYPEFFDEVEPITLKDDLAKFVGVNNDGTIEITYLEIVKMAGHSCAVVSGAYLCAQKGLKALFGNELPKRGEIKVELKKAPDEDNTGVVGCVLSNITGATTDYGFGGLAGGKFNRRNLLFYNAPIDTDIRFTRTDTGRQVGVNYRPGKVVNPAELFKNALGPKATPEQKKAFPRLFQEMVKTILTNGETVIEVVEM